MDVNRWVALGLGFVLLAFLLSGCSGAPKAAKSSSSTTSSTTSSAPMSVTVSVITCPFPASDYAGTSYKPESPPSTLTVPASLAPPEGAQIFGAAFPPGGTSYLMSTASASCQGQWGSADGGELMTATVPSDQSEGVTMNIRPGGAGPSAYLSCPYIPAVIAALQASGGTTSTCVYPPADVVQQIATGVPGANLSGEGSVLVDVAAVWVPAQVKDPNLDTSGNGADPTVALFTAATATSVTPQDFAGAEQMISCTLPTTERGICTTSLEFFLTTQTSVDMEVSKTNLAEIEATLSTFLSQH